VKEGKPAECDTDLHKMVKSLQDVFGDRALEVATRQSELADEDSAAIWRRIVEMLGG
jgi:hypothetical protein